MLRSPMISYRSLLYIVTAMYERVSQYILGIALHDMAYIRS